MSSSTSRVTVIPPTMRMFSPTPINSNSKRRVAAYARVSTDNDEQLSSFDAQMDYYTRHIQSNPEWKFVSVYTDEGISATSTKRRDGFKTMIADAIGGKIDLIITKSVSRFARNTVDTLTTVRQLKEKGVEVYFEKENIYTLDSKGELLITIMSSLAQEESRSISENVTWGQRKRMQDGKVTMPYKHFLGYEKGKDGLPKIVESEAAVVRLIYKMFLEGKTPSFIAKHLTAEGIPTPAGKEVWQTTTVQSILKNEKYKGDAILQKSFTIDFLTKKTKLNEGEIPQYYVENSHPAIISEEVFDLAQHELKRRKEAGRLISSGGWLSSRLICGDCGGFYGSKQWHSNSKYQRTVWQCNSKFKKRKICKTPHLNEDDIKQAFLGAFNSLIENKDELIEGYRVIIKALSDTTVLEKKLTSLQSEMSVIVELMMKCVEENASTALDQREYEKKYNALAQRFEDTKGKIAEADRKITEQKSKRRQLESFLAKLSESDTLLTEFDEALWYATVESVVIHHNRNVFFNLKDGTAHLWRI